MLKITERIGGESIIGEILPPGVYNHGLLTVPSLKDSEQLTENLEWSIYHQYRVIAYNCMGDMFIQNRDSSAIGYLWLQYGYGRFISDNIEQWHQLITTNEEAKCKFLETSAQSHIINIKGPLPYGSVYTLRPIKALGGSATIDSLNSCGIGHFNVYLSIVSQTFSPEGWGEFA